MRLPPLKSIVVSPRRHNPGTLNNRSHVDGTAPLCVSVIGLSIESFRRSRRGKHCVSSYSTPENIHRDWYFVAEQPAPAPHLAHRPALHIHKEVLLHALCSSLCPDTHAPHHQPSLAAQFDTCAMVQTCKHWYRFAEHRLKTDSGANTEAGIDRFVPAVRVSGRIGERSYIHHPHGGLRPLPQKSGFLT